MVGLKWTVASILLLGLLSACGIAAPRAPAAVLPTAHVILASTPSADPTTASSPAAQPATPLPATAVSAAPTPTTEPVPSATTIATPAAPTPAAPSITATATLSADGAANLSALEAGLFAAINRERATNNLPPYLNNAELNTAAHGHSCDMAEHTLISHTSSDGRALKDRLAGSSPPWERMSESIAAGSDDPAFIVALWMDEPPEGWHRRNILDTELREVGVGYCYASEDSTGNHHYWTADFARRSGP
jgi:uncharacterized protein YkwD